MSKIFDVTDTVKYIGVDDKEMDLFENQYILKNGISKEYSSSLTLYTPVIDLLSKISAAKVAFSVNIETISIVKIMPILFLVILYLLLNYTDILY